MGHLKTSAHFYRRGIPNGVSLFGSYVLSNYVIPQPSSLFKLNSNYFNFAFRNNNRYR